MTKPDIVRPMSCKEENDERNEKALVKDFIQKKNKWRLY